MWQPGYYNLLTEKRIRKFTLLKYSFSWKVLTLSISRNSPQTPFLDDIFLGNFASSNSIIFVEELIKWKRCFEIFLIDHCASDIGHKNIAGKY